MRLIEVLCYNFTEKSREKIISGSQSSQISLFFGIQGAEKKQRYKIPSQSARDLKNKCELNKPLK